jgi:hypothetical protein
MPCDQEHYGSRGGNLAIVLRCPNIVADDRLVYFDYNKQTLNWVIRDFIAGKRLDNFQSHHSTLTIRQIEADAIYSEYPPWLNVETNPEDWKNYLTHRTTALRKLNMSLHGFRQPNSASGNWQPL